MSVMRRASASDAKEALLLHAVNVATAIAIAAIRPCTTGQTVPSSGKDVRRGLSATQACADVPIDFAAANALRVGTLLLRRVTEVPRQRSYCIDGEFRMGRAHLLFHPSRSVA